MNSRKKYDERFKTYAQKTTISVFMNITVRRTPDQPHGRKRICGTENDAAARSEFFPNAARLSLPGKGLRFRSEAMGYDSRWNISDYPLMWNRIGLRT